MSKKNQTGVAALNLGSQDAEQPDTIRIIIRDAKPPLLARLLQGSMRILCILLFLCVCAIGIPRLFGVYEFNVLTGSMTPDYPIGTLVFVQPKDPSSIHPGEVVSVVMNEELDVLTHRVVSNDYDKKQITTKGDANNSPDAPTLYENVLGVVCFSVPHVGAVVDYFTNDTTGRIVGIGILIVVLVLTFLAEGISSALTKQNANVFGQDEPQSDGDAAGDGDGDEDAVGEDTGALIDSTDDAAGDNDAAVGNAGLNCKVNRTHNA